MTRRSRFFSPAGWLSAGLFFLLGIFCEFALIGYSFSAYICFGIAGLLVCWQLLGLLKQNKPRLGLWLRRILAAGVLLGLLAVGITLGFIASAARGNPAAVDYVVVLGAGVNGTVPSLSLRERLNAACDYLTAHPESICVVSGCQGNGEDISEAQCMYNELTEMGIDPARVWMEDQARNTRENLSLSLDIIESRTGRRPETVGIVSSEYHLYRAGFFAREQGLEPVGIPARTSWVSLRVNYYLREVAAVWYYMILGG